jgi:hypothetical protein
VAFLGNANGPRESEVVDELGHEYFGITPQALEDDISDYAHSERRGHVVPVHVDEEGRPFVLFTRPNGPNRFYLVGRFKLVGAIATRTPEEQRRWDEAQKRGGQ